MSDCPFCRVVAGTLPARTLHEDATTVAFLDTAPASRGHTLVVPRVHVVDLWDADADVLADVARTAHAVAARLRERLGFDVGKQDVAGGVFLHEGAGIDMTVARAMLQGNAPLPPGAVSCGPGEGVGRAGAAAWHGQRAVHR